MSNELFDLRPLGHQLQRIRVEKGLSLQAGADLADMEKKSLHRYENAQVNPSIQILLRIAHGWDVNLSDIVRALDHKPHMGSGDRC